MQDHKVGGRRLRPPTCLCRESDRPIDSASAWFPLIYNYWFPSKDLFDAEGVPRLKSVHSCLFVHYEEQVPLRFVLQARGFSMFTRALGRVCPDLHLTVKMHDLLVMLHYKTKGNTWELNRHCIDCAAWNCSGSVKRLSLVPGVVNAVKVVLTQPTFLLDKSSAI